MRKNDLLNVTTSGEVEEEVVFCLQNTDREEGPLSN